jgi:Rrf2 family nitric oxide-sensitive transcriptional repressor
MKLQISSRLAVFALLELSAHPDQQYSVADIGRKYRISNHHLAKVMHALGRAGLVRSIRGVGGGFQFSGNTRRTTLLDVIELFENLTLPEVGNADDKITGEELALQQVLGEIDDISRATLGSITLATMLKLSDRHRQKVRPSGRRARSSRANLATAL